MCEEEKAQAVLDGLDRRWCYVEPAWPDSSPREIVKTEGEILREMFQSWSEGMHELGYDDLISEENCIHDWAIVHWAWRID